MENRVSNLPAEIATVVEEIARLLTPDKIYMFSNKRGEKGRTAGFKLCVVAEHGGRDQAERDIYLKIDSDVPFDIVLYSPSEWEELCGRKSSFASRIVSMGVLVYG